MKLAFVIPWFGLEIPGGAEAACRTTVRYLHEAGLEVEVLTTCIKEFRSDWGQNYHRPGCTTLEGIPVRRFQVGRRDCRAFGRLNARLMKGLPITEDEETLFLQGMFCCDALVEFLRSHRHEYVYFFIPYMFPTTYWGTLACPERAVLVPCLHDESYAYLNIYQAMFAQARGVVFHSQAEQALAEQLYSLRPDAGVLVGSGLPTHFQTDPDRFRNKYGVEDFVLYAGRRDEGKNVPLLVDYFCRYKELCPTELKLVLLGDGPVQIPPDHAEDIVDLGFVPVQDKWDAYAAARVLCQPSLNESFSIVLMEAWLAQTPVLVHEQCAVTREHCLASSGGLYFSSLADFIGCLDYLRANRELARRLARNGRQYVLANYRADRIVHKYRRALAHWGFEL
jgi:glycosyltransferase involved in cell wall biosynthesis